MCPPTPPSWFSPPAVFYVLVYSCLKGSLCWGTMGDKKKKLRQPLLSLCAPSTSFLWAAPSVIALISKPYTFQGSHQYSFGKNALGLGNSLIQFLAEHKSDRQ